MKKVKYIIFMVICGVLCLTKVDAASFNVSAKSSSVIVGNNVTVTVTVSGNEVGAWTYCLNYDTSKLTFVSSTANGGGTCVNDGVVDLVSRTTTFQFKAKASGTSTVGLSSAVAYDYNTEQPLNATKGSIKITARTQAEIEASYSTNANLKSLTVSDYELSPEFKKDVLEYNVEVENEIESIVITATKEDNAAHVLGDGEKTLTEGINKFVITVTAEKGNKKEYVVNVVRKELDPIYVKYDNKNFTVVRKADALETINFYSSTVTIIDDVEVPALKSDITGYLLIGLKDEDGNIDLYRYDINNGQFYQYIQLPPEGLTIIPEEAPSLLTGYEAKKEIIIKDYKVTAYYNENGNSNYVIVYGMNAATGVKDWYQYDLEEGTFQRFQSKEIIKLQEDLKDYYLLVIIFAIGLGLSIILVISLLIKNSKVKRKNIKLLTLLENGQVVEKNYVVEEQETSDNQEEVEEIQEQKIDSREKIEENITEQSSPKRKEKKKKIKKKAMQEVEEPVVEDESLEESLEEVKEEVQEIVHVQEETELESTQEQPKQVTTNRVKKNEKKQLSQREINRLEKQRKRDLEEMQEDTRVKTRSSKRNTME